MTGSKLAIISPQADNPYQRRLVQKTHNSAPRASYFRYFQWRLFTNIILHTTLSGHMGLITVHEKYFLLITFDRKQIMMITFLEEYETQ